MKITDIRMEIVEKPMRVLANFNVVFDKEFVIKNMALLKGERKGKETMYINFPSRMNKEGQYINVCHPINSDFRSYVEQEIIKYYQENK